MTSPKPLTEIIISEIALDGFEGITFLGEQTFNSKIRTFFLLT